MISLLEFVRIVWVALYHKKESMTIVYVVNSFLIKTFLFLESSV